MSHSDSPPNKRNKSSHHQNEDRQTITSADSISDQHQRESRPHFGVAHSGGFQQAFHGSVQASFGESMSRSAHPYTREPVLSPHYLSYGQENGVPMISSAFSNGGFSNHCAPHNGFHHAIPDTQSESAWNSGTPYQQQYQPMIHYAQQPLQQPIALPTAQSSSAYLNPCNQPGPRRGPITQSAMGPLLPRPTTITASVPQKTWSCPSSDTTLPTTDQARRNWVLQVANAIKNTDGVCDRQTASFLKRWGPVEQGGEPFYSAIDVEIISWDILTLAEQLHMKGPSGLKSFDTRFWQSAALSQHWTFAERMNKIIDLLAHSKARCDKLMQGVSLQNVVANPEKMMKVTKQNGIQNKKRQQTLVAGRKSLKRKAGESE